MYPLSREQLVILSHCSCDSCLGGRGLLVTTGMIWWAGAFLQWSDWIIWRFVWAWIHHIFWGYYHQKATPWTWATLLLFYSFIINNLNCHNSLFSFYDLMTWSDYLYISLFLKQVGKECLWKEETLLQTLSFYSTSPFTTDHILFLAFTQNVVKMPASAPVMYT